MTVTELYQLLGAIVTIVGGAWALIRLSGAQFETRLDERFAAQEKARQEGRELWESRMSRMEQKTEKLESEVRQILIELPREYVARADYVRRETVIEAKIDQLALKWENWTLKKEARA